MRSRQLRTLVVSLVLALTFSSFPVMAKPSERDGRLDRDLPFLSKVIKQIRKAFGVVTNGDGLTLPTP
jgi:hypothetical protein